MNSDRNWINAIRVVFYGLAIVSLMLPFAVLFVIDPGDPNHVRTFAFFTVLAGALAIAGKLITMAMEALTIYIQRNRSSHKH